MPGEGTIGGSECLIENVQYSGLKVYVERHLNAGAADTVVCTGLERVVAVAVGLDGDSGDGQIQASASIGDQAGSPAAGSVYVKLWKVTNAANDCTPAAADDTGVAITVVAVGY
ncbi:MAG: hypothetical protein JXQ29_18655 [Planctomycetes bacterium]|nr:hypothetical protein [Planctomycetota bacterium]